MRKYLPFFVVLFFGAVGCNSYKVQALPFDAGLKDVFVINNPKVIVNDFV